MPSRARPIHPSQRPEYSEFYLPRQRIFFIKNDTSEDRKNFFMQRLFPQSPVPVFCSKSRIYRQLDARATQSRQNCDLHIFGIDFFFRPPYIVLAVVSENSSALPLQLFFANANKSLQLHKLLLFSGKQIHYSQALPSSAIGISNLMFSRFVV